MKIILIVILYLVSQPSIVAAQQTETKKHIRFQSINQVGLLAGSSDAALQLQSIVGIKKNTWFTGLGLGLDYYYSRSVPVFLDVRKNIFNKPITPFVYADGGCQFAWSSKKDEKISWMGDKKDGGLYYELGIGYSVPVYRKIQLLFTAGYSYKHLSETVNTIPWLSIWPPPPNAFDKYEYSLRRIALKAGLSF